MNDVSTETEPEVIERPVELSGQNPLPDMTDAALKRDPADKLRVLCARSPIIKQLVRGAVYAKVAPAFDHNIAIWSIEDAQRHTGQAFVRIYNHVGDPIGYFTAQRNKAALDAQIGGQGACSWVPPVEIDRKNIVVNLYGLETGVHYGEIDCASCGIGGCRFTGRVDSDLDIYFQCPDEDCDGDSSGHYQFYVNPNNVGELLGKNEAMIWWEGQVCSNTDCDNYDQHTVAYHTGRCCETHGRVICQTDCCGTIQEVSDEN